MARQTLFAALCVVMAIQLGTAASSRRELQTAELQADAAAASVDATKSEDFKPYEVMFMLNGWKCKEANEGTYTPYTVEDCLEKTKARGYDAFLYRSSDSTCKIFPKCTPKNGNKGGFHGTVNYSGEQLYMYEFGGN